jgi:hypothetical protein
MVGADNWKNGVYITVRHGLERHIDNYGSELRMAWNP